MKRQYKSFGLHFDSNTFLSLSTDLYKTLEPILASSGRYWLHFENPSKNLQQRLGKCLAMPKDVREVLFATEVRPRCIKFNQSFILIVQGIQSSNMNSEQDYPTLRCWVTQKGILTISTGPIDSVSETLKELSDMQETSSHECLAILISNIIRSLEETIHDLDERLYQTESRFQYTEDTSDNTMRLRQDIIYVRRYIFPQRDALINLAQLSLLNEPLKSCFKEYGDSMVRHSESIEMLRERAVIVQEHLNNQIAELMNQRIYVLTIFMLIFTPAFFIMGLFSMYLPIPGMNSDSTWWIVSSLIVTVSYGLYKLFRKKGWI